MKIESSKRVRYGLRLALGMGLLSAVMLVTAHRSGIANEPPEKQFNLVYSELNSGGGSSSSANFSMETVIRVNRDEDIPQSSTNFSIASGLDAGSETQNPSTNVRAWKFFE